VTFIGPESRGSLSVRELAENRGESLALELLTADADLDREVADADISSPGLALAGYTNRVPQGRM